MRKIHHFFVGRPTISMVIFNSYVKLPKGMVFDSRHHRRSVDFGQVSFASVDVEATRFANLRIHLRAMHAAFIHWWKNSEANQRSWYMSEMSVFCDSCTKTKTGTVFFCQQKISSPKGSLKLLGSENECGKVIDAIDNSHTIIPTCSIRVRTFYLLGNGCILLQPSWFKQTCTWVDV